MVRAPSLYVLKFPIWIVVETHAQVQRQPAGDAPVILDESLIARLHHIRHGPRPFAVRVEIPHPGVAKTVLDVTRHGRGAAEAVAAQVRARSCLLDLLVVLPIETGLRSEERRVGEEGKSRWAPG